MSKKMWHKIFKSKAQKQQQQLNKINKRHSRGIYEEYQQLNDLLNGEKSPVLRFCSENENENGNNNSGSGSGNINVFEQQPQQSSFNSAALSEAQQQQQQQPLPQQQQQSQHLSTFSRVRNTFSLRRNNNNNNSSSSSNNKKQTPNAKSTTMEPDGADDDNEPVGPPPGPLTTGMSETILEQGTISTDLTPCPNCSRTFNLNALRKHVVVCEKMTTKKRKIFDSSRQRREGTSLSTYVLPKNFGLPNAEKAPGVHTPPAASREASTMSSGSQPQEASPLPTRRKAKADTTRASMRKGAGATAAAAAEHPPAAAPAAPAAAAPTRSIAKRLKDSASDRCPHCERSFNPKAYDRHVEWCKEKAIQANIKSNSTTETNKAKERMEARKQYRPPNLKTKRSINRDKYSGAQEEQYETEMVSPKQNLMSLSSMTASVQSVNSQRGAPQAMKVQRPGTPQGAQCSPRKSKASSSSTTTVAQNKVSVRMAAEESSMGHQERAYVNPRRKQHETCQEIDVAVQRLRRTATSETLHLAKLECAEAAPLQPARSRKTMSHRHKTEATECMAGPPQVTMTFEELNGLIKRKGGTNICNIKMDIEEQDLKVSPKIHSSTALVRQARRRIRTRENPNIDIRSLEPPKSLSEFDLSSKEMVLSNVQQGHRALPSPAAFRHISSNDLYSGSEDERTSPRGEIQIKLETSTIQTVCRPKKRTHLPAIMNSSQPMRAVPMAELKQNLEALGQNFLPHLERGNGLKGHYKEEQDDDLDDAELDELDYDEADMEVGQLLNKAKLLESEYDDEMDDGASSEEDQQLQQKMLVKQTSMRRTPTNVSRRLVLLEQDEEGTMYIKAPPSPTKRQQARSPPRSDRTLVKRSDSNVSSSGGSYKSPQASCGSYKTTPNSSGSYKTPPNSNSSYKTPLTSSDEKLQRQQSNASTSSSNNCHAEKAQKSVEESQKREIFISIETEPNAQGRSPISPDSLRHMVGNAQTPIDVLHIENGNEPEHAKFSKISDNEDPIDAELADETGHVRYKKRLSSTASTAATSPSPNVEANNAKNVIEKMRNDFKQLGEEVGASVRRDIMQRQEHAQQKQQMQAQQDLKVMTPSPSGDSDELSSLDGYPMSSSQSSRRGASSKLSNDSAYGSNSPYSLSRQRSSELQSNNNTPRTQSQLRPHTASGALSGKQSMMDASTQAASNYGTLKARQRMFAGNGLGGDTGDGNVEYSSSSSEHSLPVTVAQQPQQQQQNTNYNYQQQQQQSQAQVAYNTNNNNNDNNNYELNAKNLSKNKNSGVGVNLTPTTSQLSLQSNTSNVSSGMSSSMKMSKFCHECGAKFVIEHAKFCMDCGVRRVVL
ncbi:uncharacterized protein LOC135428140 isoform X2 [Drosophila montana]|uniref:uncharacterized protein LOC135428140 isoform X2 n=1 Tax=Drosophila montana TaxID=40370 RepID=UPI00313D4205